MAAFAAGTHRCISHGFEGVASPGVVHRWRDHARRLGDPWFDRRPTRSARLGVAALDVRVRRRPRYRDETTARRRYDGVLRFRVVCKDGGGAGASPRDWRTSVAGRG